MVLGRKKTFNCASNIEYKLNNMFPIASLGGFAGNKEKKTLRSAQELVDAGLMDSEHIDAVNEMAKRYAIAMTPDMRDLAKQGHDLQGNDWKNDPIAKQFVPDLREMTILPQELPDPIGDYNHSPFKALVHRHKNRVLLKPTNVCAVYCRFCFRREMVGPEGDSISQSDVDAALDYIAEHSEISEVILTGGDPLMLSIRRLEPLMQRLHAIPHLRYIRFHTRIPVVAPAKISDEIVAILHGDKRVIMAIHANHAREFTADASAALNKLANKGIMLLGQSVLLKGINDNVSALADLCETMLDNHIKPYYLHHPDLTTGTSHFRMSFESGMALMDELRQRVSGIAVPQYTLDIPGGVSKIAITSANVMAVKDKPGHYVLRDIFGQMHEYADVI